MSPCSPAEDALIVVGLISSDERLFGDIERPLSRITRHVPALKSRVMPFLYTDYYFKEFGHGLKRLFLVYPKIRMPEALFALKRKTNALEERLSTSGKRRINIDPGYLTRSRLVLFTTKDYSHRIYLGKGIYGEVTLNYRAGSYTPWPWTYPDYRSDEYIAFFNDARDLL